MVWEGWGGALLCLFIVFFFFFLRGVLKSHRFTSGLVCWFFWGVQVGFSSGFWIETVEGSLLVVYFLLFRS